MSEPFLEQTCQDFTENSTNNNSTHEAHDLRPVNSRKLC